MSSRVPMPRLRRSRALAGAALLLLGACGGGDPLMPDPPAALQANAATPHAPAVARVPGDRAVRAESAGRHAQVLDAPPGLLLASNLRDYAAPELQPQAAAADRAPATSAARFVVTALPTVTVGEVSRTLSAAGTRIVEMRAHDLTFSIEATDGATADARERVISRLEASRLFESVLPVN